MTNRDSILKSRDISLPTKFHLVKAMVFPVVMYGCESWPVKKAECQRTDAFELWCWRRLLRVPWTAKRSNQSILKEISPGCSLEGMMLKLKLQYCGHFMRRVDSLKKTRMLGGIGGRKRRGRQRMRWLDGITDSMDMSLGPSPTPQFKSINSWVLSFLFVCFIYLFLRTYHWLVLYRMQPWERHLWIRKHPTKEMPTTSSTLTFFANF